MINTISINIIIAIIQIIFMLAVAYWQISVAKSIARNEIGTKKSFRTILREFLSKVSKYSFIIPLLFFVYNLYTFVSSSGQPTRKEIINLVILTSFVTLIITLEIVYRSITKIILLIEDAYSSLYCLSCKTSGENKPTCIDEIKRIAKENNKQDKR